MEQNVNSLKKALTPRQKEAAGLLLVLPSGNAVAQKVGVAPATLSRWKQEPAFIDAMEEAQRKASREVALIHTKLYRLAASELERLLAESDSDDVRSRVALGIVKSWPRIVEIAEIGELEARIAALEAQGRRTMC